MLRDYIDDLPLGISRPLFARWTGGGRTTAWVRAGDLGRSGQALVMRPRWDGEAFAILWRAAATGGALDDRDPVVVFAVPDGDGLLPVAEVSVGPRLRSQVRAALPRQRGR